MSKLPWAAGVTGLAVVGVLAIGGGLASANTTDVPGPQSAITCGAPTPASPAIEAVPADPTIGAVPADPNSPGAANHTSTQSCPPVTSTPAQPARR